MEGDAPAGALRPHRVPAHRGAVLPAHAAGLRLLLVLAGAAPVGRRRRRGRRVRSAGARRQERAQPARRRGAADAGRRPGRFPGDAPLVRRARVPRDRGPHRGVDGPGRRVRAGRARRVREPRDRTLRPACRNGDGGPLSRAARDHRDAGPARPGRDARRRDGGWPVGARGAGRGGRAYARGRDGRHDRRDALHRPGGPRGRAGEHQRPARRGGDPLRRSLPAEDVPAPRGRRESGAGARPLHECARARPHAQRRRYDRVRKAARRAEHAGGAAGLRPQRGYRLGARPRGAASFLRTRAHAPPRGRGARRGPTRAGRTGRRGTGGRHA